RLRSRIVPSLLLTMTPTIPVRIRWRSVHRFLVLLTDTSPGVYGCACIAWIWKCSLYRITKSGASFKTSRFSAFLSSASLVKLKDPVITVVLSMIIILLWAIACWSSIWVSMPALNKKVAALYFWVSFDLSLRIDTLNCKLLENQWQKV